MALYQTPIHVIGGGGGSAFSLTGGYDGKILSKIGVWAGGWFLSGIRIWLTGSDPRTFGTPNQGSYKEFTFQDGELITSLSLWGNGAGTRSGGIRFYTNRGRQFFHHMTSWSLKQEYAIDVASGICVGVMGRHGEHIDSLGFVFLRPIASARMINVRYPTLSLDTAGIVPLTLDSFTDRNDAAINPKQWRFHGSREVTIASSWSLTAGLEIHASVTVQAGIPKIAEVQGEFGWALSMSANYQTSTQTTRTLGWDQSGTLGPGEWISIQATTRSGNITLPYEATMEITLRSGAVFTYSLSGMYAGVDYTSVDIISVGTRKDDIADDGQGEDQPTTLGAEIKQPESIPEGQECTLVY